MRVFITGATGFLGSALARALALEGVGIHALVRPTADRTVLNGIPVSWHVGDIASPNSMAKAMAGAAWIVHAAGRLGEAGVPEELYFRVHVDGTRNVMAAALAVGERPRVLHVSSPGVLGPIKGNPATEDSPYAPGNPYERSKAAAERVALEFASRGLPVVVCRPEFVYGPGDRHVLGLFRAIRRRRFFYIKGGRHFCHPTFVGDAVAGMLSCLRSGRPGEIYHIVGPRPVTFRELGDTIALALGVRPPWLSLPRWPVIIAAQAMERLAHATGRKPALSRTAAAFFSEDRLFSWQKAHEALGYTPQWDLDTGVTRTIGWYRERGWL